VVTPAAVEIDPPAFALKVDANYSVADILGRLIIDGGSAFETRGDTLIVHNEDGTVSTGSLGEATIEVMDGRRGP